MTSKIKLIAALIVLALLASTVWYFTNQYNTYKNDASHYKLLNEQSTLKISELQSVIDSKEETISNLTAEVRIVSESIGAYTKQIDAANMSMQKLVADRDKKEKELSKLKREFFAKNPTLVDDKNTIDTFLKMSSEIRIDTIHQQYCSITDKCPK